MDQAAMVETRFEEGADLLRLLDETDFPVKDALWLFDPDETDWKLWIGTPLVDSGGPADVYGRLRAILDTQRPRDLELKEIVLTSPEHPLLLLLRTAVHTGPGINGIRFSRNTVNGTYVEDAYIYRLQ